MITSVVFLVAKFVSNFAQNVEEVTWTGSVLTIGSFQELASGSGKESSSLLRITQIAFI